MIHYYDCSERTVVLGTPFFDVELIWYMQHMKQSLSKNNHKFPPTGHTMRCDTELQDMNAKFQKIENETTEREITLTRNFQRKPQMLDFNSVWACTLFTMIVNKMEKNHGFLNFPLCIFLSCAHPSECVFAFPTHLSPTHTPVGHRQS